MYVDKFESVIIIL